MEASAKVSRSSDPQGLSQNQCNEINNENELKSVVHTIYRTGRHTPLETQGVASENGQTTDHSRPYAVSYTLE